MGDVGGSDPHTLAESSGIVTCYRVEYGLLRAPRHQYAFQAVCAEGCEHSVGARHRLLASQLLEEAALAGVDVADMFVGNRAMERAFPKEADGRGAGHPLVEIEFVARAYDSHFCHHLAPGQSMVFHGVVEHSVHIYQGGAGAGYFLCQEIQLAVGHFFLGLGDEFPRASCRSFL